MSIEELDTKQELGRWLLEYLEGEGLPISAVEGLSQSIEGGRVNPIALINAWANQGGGSALLGYRSLPGGLIQIRGVVSAAAAASGTVMGVVPSKPKESLQFPAVNGNGLTAAAIVVDPAGNIIGFFTAPGGNIDVNCIYGTGV